MQMPQLKEHLKSRGLSIQGSKKVPVASHSLKARLAPRVFEFLCPANEPVRMLSNVALAYDPQDLINRRVEAAC